MSKEEDYPALLVDCNPFSTINKRYRLKSPRQKRHTMILVHKYDEGESPLAADNPVFRTASMAGRPITVNTVMNILMIVNKVIEKSGGVKMMTTTPGQAPMGTKNVHQEN